MTTQQHEGAVTVPDDRWKRGGSRKQSYISPWYVTTIKHRDFDRKQGVLKSELISTAVSDLSGYTGR